MSTTPMSAAGAGPAIVTPPHRTPPAERLVSLDALRGFDMLWIVGADALGGALAGLKGGPIVHFLAEQMEHVDWEGFHFYDLIFPLFVFMIGVALTFSLDRLVTNEGRTAALRRVFRRGLLLYLLGLVYYGGFMEGYEQIRLLGVLQRLALCYVGASVLYLYLKPRALVVAFAGILVTYWALLMFVPVPGVGAGDFAEGRNLADWIDSRYLPLRKWNGDHDPEGILSTLPALASCLLGVFAGLLLRDRTHPPLRKVALLAAGGVAMLAAGYLWGLQFPIIKRLWTSSYVLVAGGWSALLLAAFYYVIDVRGIRRWATPFIWIGGNALTIYLISNVIDFNALSARFVGGEVAAALDAAWAGLGRLTLALVGIALCVGLCGFLYRRKIFLRL
jgi:predicted acyltransferase